MKKLLTLFLIASIAISVGCSKDEEETRRSSGTSSNTENDNDNDGNGGENTPYFSAEITGDLTADYSGMAYYEEDDGNINIVMANFGGDWVSTTIVVAAPPQEKIYTTALDLVMGQLEEDEFHSATSNGDYYFFVTNGEVEITKVEDEFIHGEFNINYEYSDSEETKNVNIKGSFIADED